MSSEAKIDYEVSLPYKERGEFYIVKCKDPSMCAEVTCLLHSGELVKACYVSFKSTVSRLVFDEGGKYLGIGVVHI
jgi:hypothetical protein